MSQKNNYMTSVITPFYKSIDFVSHAIDSVIAQTHDNWEMIIVDDCSPDDQCLIFDNYLKNERRIKLIRLDQNMGQAVARNTAIKHASGRYIAFLDSDDMWKPDKLEKQIKFMQENNLAFTYSSYDIIDEKNNKMGTFLTKPCIDYTSMLKTCSVGCLTAIYDTHMLGKIYMDTKFRRQEDYILWLNILKKIKTTKGILEPLAYYRISNNTVSSNKLKSAMSQWNVYRKIENLGFLDSLYYFANYSINGFMKYKIHK